MEVISDETLDEIRGRLHISLTSTRMESLITSSFCDRESLVDALACSCFIPLFSGYKIPKYCGKKYMDGGITNQLPVLNDTTIKISPFSGKYKDICPPDKASLSLSFANENIYLSKVNLQRAFHAVRYLSDEKLYYYYNLGFDCSELFIKKCLET